MTYITEPGYVTEQTNEKFIYLYQKTRKYSLNRADMYNEMHNLVKENRDDNGCKHLFPMGCHNRNLFSLVVSLPATGFSTYLIILLFVSLLK